MRRRAWKSLAVLVAGAFVPEAIAGHGGGHHHGNGGAVAGAAVCLPSGPYFGAAVGGWGSYGYGYGYGYRYGYGPPFALGPVVSMSPPVPFAAPQVWNAGMGQGGAGFNAAPAPAASPQPARRSNPTRAHELMTLGDRVFRAGNFPRAEERYEQALRANPSAAAPRVRLAQLAVSRGQYTEAAERFREAHTAEPAWLEHPLDVETLYSEPGDFARVVGKLEAHLQANPNDRDAWLVLGAELFLSGSTRQSADVFLRLTDRTPDATLDAFLTAARAR